MCASPRSRRPQSEQKAWGFHRRFPVSKSLSSSPSFSLEPTLFTPPPTPHLENGSFPRGGVFLHLHPPPPGPAALSHGGPRLSPMGGGILHLHPPRVWFFPSPWGVDSSVCTYLLFLG